VKKHDDFTARSLHNNQTHNAQAGHYTRIEHQLQPLAEPGAQRRNRCFIGGVYFAMLNGVGGREIFGVLWVIGPIKRCVVGSESGGGLNVCRRVFSAESTVF
jgi:hypothetical protein